MIRALSTAASGMEAEQLKLDVTANNLANVNTPGFKKSRGEFQDLLYQTLRAPGTAQADGVELPTGLQVGQGARVVATHRIHTVGDLKQTGNPLDLAIEGAGFFPVSLPNGVVGYTRAGDFKTDSQGRIVNPDGYPLDPAIVVPPQATTVAIGTDGTVTATLQGEAAPLELGRVQTAMFANPAGLEAIGRNLLLPTGASGAANLGAPGEDGRGSLAQGTLEMSNVKVVEEMIDLIAGQRSYEVNSKVVQAADEMLRNTTSMR